MKSKQPARYQFYNRLPDGQAMGATYLTEGSHIPEDARLPEARLAGGGQGSHLWYRGLPAPKTLAGEELSRFSQDCTPEACPPEADEKSSTK